MRSRTWTPLVLAALLAPPARAEEPAARAVTLAEALAAVAGTPGRRAAAQQTRAAEADVGAAGAWPSFGLGAATTLHTPRAVLTLTVPLPIWGTVAAARDGARADLDVARAEERAAELEQRQRVTAAWIELARAEAQATVATEIAAEEARLAEVAHRRLDAGDASHADAVTADAAAARAQADAAAARDAIGAASAALAAELAWEPERALHADPGLPEPAPAAGKVRPAANHPELSAARARVAGAAARVRQARRARFPQLSLDLEADLDDPTLPGSDFRAGVSLDVPLLGHGGDAERAASLRRSAAELERDRAELAVRGRVVVAERKSRAAALRATTLARDVLPAQREAAALARTAYREGQGRLSDVLAAERALADAQLEEIAARAEAATARAELEQATAEGP